MERFLYRLSKSEHADRFVLKGALMLQLWGGPLTRATKDIDLLGRASATVDELVSVVRLCLAVDVDDDGLRFDPDSVAGEEIRLTTHYDGVMVESERMPGAADSFLSLLHACLRLPGPRPEVALTAEQLPGLRYSVQLLWADDDPFGDVDIGRRVAELIPDAELHVVPGGHAPWVNAPTRVGQLATTFLCKRYAAPLGEPERFEEPTAATHSRSRNGRQSLQSG